MIANSGPAMADLAKKKCVPCEGGMLPYTDAQAKEISRMSDLALERLRTVNPCARALPLLAALAGRHPQIVTLERDAGQTLSVCVRTI